MILFPKLFVQVMIVGSIILTGLAFILLIVLLAFDFKNKNIW